MSDRLFLDFETAARIAGDWTSMARFQLARTGSISPEVRAHVDPFVLRELDHLGAEFARRERLRWLREHFEQRLSGRDYVLDRGTFGVSARFVDDETRPHAHGNPPAQYFPSEIEALHQLAEWQSQRQRAHLVSGVREPA